MAVIASLMKTDLVTARPDEAVRDVAERMERNGVGAVLVVEGDALRGLFSERDLLRRVVVPGHDPAATKLESVMTPEPVTLDVNAHVRSCAELLRERGFRHLPVMEDGRPVGILSGRDFTDYVVQGLERFIDQARYEKELASGSDPYDHLGGSYDR
jgi:CBS domain-containing protein